jgi:hypothetical protein
MRGSTAQLSRRDDGLWSHSITENEFPQDVPMTLQLILGAVAHERHRTLPGELLQQPQRKLLSMVLNGSAAQVDRTI